MRFVVYIAFLFLANMLSAQQLPQFSLWSQNSYLLNPALTGITKTFDLKTGYRTQWLGLEGAPSTGYLSAHGVISNRRAGYLTPYQGIGGDVQRDVFGGFSNFTVNVSYGIHFPMGKNELLSFGAKVGAQQISFDQINATTIDPDIAIATNVNNFLFPRISFGAWYKREFLFFGASIDQLTRGKWKDIGFDSRFRLHATLTGGFKYTNDKEISFLPKFLLRIGPNAPLNAEIQTLFDFQNKFALGLGYRTQDALIALLKIKVEDNVKIGYSFDFPLSKIRGGNFGSHELMLSFNTARNSFLGASETPLFE